MQKLNFEELKLSKETLKAIQDLGFEQATPIQSKTIPLLLDGKNIVGQAATGSGKTAAFAIPIIEQIDPKDKSTQAIILCPVRELAIQIAEEFNKFLKYKRNIFTLPVYGGQPIERQISKLRRGVHIIIATPGRALDHIQRKTLNLKNVKMAVLDEADEMLKMGFREDIEEILKHTPAKKQTTLFSATMPSEILNLIKRILPDYQLIKIEHEKLSAPKIEQLYYDARGRSKLDILTSVLDIYNPSSCIIFCNTKRKADDVAGSLNARGYLASAIHGDITQAKRSKIMEKFKAHKLDILVATDVAARGIDIQNVAAVINFDIPQDEESYVHRIGRTGRAGKEGKAFSFVGEREYYEFKDILRYTKAHIKQAELPSPKEVAASKNKELAQSIKKIISGGNLKDYTTFIEELAKEGLNLNEIAAALLKMLSKK